MPSPLIRPFADINRHDVALVGGKNASLGEMVGQLGRKGVRVPDGFATTAAAYWLYLDHNGLRDRIADRLDGLDTADVASLQRAGADIRAWLVAGEMPPALGDAIAAAYAKLEAEYGPATDVAVRSSATAEDLPDASFAGQQETYLNIRGAGQLLTSCRHVFASLFTDRAIAYRVHKGFAHMKVALSIGVQKMVRADLGAAGVMFTLDTESGFPGVVSITAAWGLGENVVQGAVNPDEFTVHKATLRAGFRPILKRQLGSKALRMVYSDSTGRTTRNEKVSLADQQRFALSDDEVLDLARQALVIEDHYGCPMDIEWAKDGGSGELFIVQARPETVHGGRNPLIQEVYRLDGKGEVLARGKSIGQKIGAGPVRVVRDKAAMRAVRPGDVIVADITDPDWEPVMKTASAIVTNRGGRTCHAAIIARELGIPAVVGTGDATEVLAEGSAVTVSCAGGEKGLVYAGLVPFTREAVDLGALPHPRTHIMLIAGNPGQAFAVAQLPNSGVGLARMEFIISNHIGVHPRALLEFERLAPALQSEIREHIQGYASPVDFYVDKLAEGIATLAAAFYPKPVIIRTSDFKSNEYAQLVGGREFEPTEENPMIGFRGASRYYADSFRECFALECRAIRQVREAMGLTNLEVMLPFVRTVGEVEKVSAIMAEHGLGRGENGLRLILMCEIPANALLAEEFLKHCDGFSIGSNDLTQLTLGVDRDSGLLPQFDERDPAVAALMAMAIAACRKEGKYIGICGQAPSDFPEITRWLVARGIGSIALNPDSLLKMTRIVAEAEAEADN
ncbi:MAG TPA: phosphoenolpyruvate synthase [Porticoccaceae bacterium]|nr:phosphoenolpyruvate synthase [Porticoccaceae bacterium]